MARFNEKRNPEPSRTTHHTPLEIAWTVVPVLILVAIAIPSFRLLFALNTYFPRLDLDDHRHRQSAGTGLTNIRTSGISPQFYHGARGRLKRVSPGS